VRTGREYLAGLRDGRRIYVGAERVDDVVGHAGFRGAAETIAGLFELKLTPASGGDMVVDDGVSPPYSSYFLMPRTREDLAKRFLAHSRIAEASCGLLGRSPDHVAGLITGLAMEADVFDAGEEHDFASHVRDYHRNVRARDAYVAYAVLPHRSRSGKGREKSSANAALRVVQEDRDGVVLHGLKGIATAAVLADEVWIGNLQPLSEGLEAEAITCAVPCNAPGLEIWSRRPFAAFCASEADNPLTWRFDEGDAVLVFDHVKVRWPHVFVHRDPLRSSDVYLRTPAHCLANHQSAVRSLAKVRLLVGVASRVASTLGTRDIPAVRHALGRLASLESALAALVDAQLERPESWPGGGLSPNRRYVYATLDWCQVNLPSIVDVLRELAGSGAFRFPADISALASGDTRETFARMWGEPDRAIDQIKLFKLVWDLTGSEFAGRQAQYEQFYAGPNYVVTGHNLREAPWSAFEETVRRLLDRRS
jgi:4-hydroxyphenylacetate 3-monooxygenase